jgi:hypothetical protein
MSDPVATDVKAAETAVTTEVKTLRQKVVAYFASHVVATAIGSAVAGAIVGHIV